MSPCPACEGAGKVLAVLCPAGGSLWETSLGCPICRGEGEISEEQERRIEAGRAMRAERLRTGLSQRQAAAALGISVEELSKREAGLLVESTNQTTIRKEERNP